MNLVLLEPGELEEGRASLGGRRAQHIALIHRAAPGKRLRVGLLGGGLGSAVVVSVSAENVVLGDVVLDRAPPPPLACTLVLALPRPIVLARVLAAATSFGIKRIVLFGSQRVEKSYWQSPALGEDAIRARLLGGLEQGCDTIVPLLEMHRRFRPFVEDRLPDIARASLALVAHPDATDPCPRAGGAAVTLVVGPEGGFLDFELELLRAAGVKPVTLGPRPLRVEFAVAALLGRLF